MGKNLHKGYYGQYSGNSKFSKKHDEDYDAEEAHNKNLTASARLHYLENLRHDHDSAAKMSALTAHGDEFREKAKAASKGEQGDYDYDDPKVVALLDKAKKADAEHQKEQPDAAPKMSALLNKKFDRTAEDIERRQRERLEKEAAKKKQKK